jgi:hypothetical protein
LGVDVCFDNGRIDAQFLAVFQPESNSGLNDQFVDHLERRRSEPVKDPVESIMFGNELAVETSEPPQGVSVGDPLSQLAIIPILDPHQSERAQHLHGRETISSSPRILQTTLQISAYLFHQVSVLVYKIGDGLQHRLQAYALAEKFDIGKTDLTPHGSCHFLAFAFLRFL